MAGMSYAAIRRQIGANTLRRVQPGKAGDYIGRAEIELRPGDKVVLWVAESGREQERNRNMDAQEANLRQVAALLGLVVIAVVRHVGSRVEKEWTSIDWHDFAIAVDLANKHGAAILAESTCRYIRHPGYRRNPRGAAKLPKYLRDWHKLQPRDSDLQGLQEHAEGVRMLTVLDPDAPWELVRSHQTKRGQQGKSKRGGRPSIKKPGYKKRIRLKLLPEVMRLREAEATLDQIVERLNAKCGSAAKRRTVANWLKNPVPFFADANQPKAQEIPVKCRADAVLAAAGRKTKTVRAHNTQ